MFTDAPAKLGASVPLPRLLLCPLPCFMLRVVLFLVFRGLLGLLGLAWLFRRRLVEVDEASELIRHAA